MNGDKKKLLWIAIAAVALIAVVLMPTPEGLTPEGKNVLGIVLFALIIWITDAFPVGISAFAILFLIPVLGILSIGDTFKGFISTVIFFVIATYAISVAIMNSPLAIRITRGLLKWAGGSTGKVLFAFMLASAFLSSIMSNVPVTALMMGLALGIIEPMGAQPGKSRLGRCFMLAIPFSAMLGGITTPAGSSVNILALFLLEEHAGITISFVKWMVMGIPICLILLPIMWWILMKMFKPEKIDQKVLEPVLNSIDVPEKLTVKEWKIIIIVLGMSVLWVLSSWIPALDITVVAMGGLLVFFLPGMNLFTWDEFNKGVGWDGVLLIGSVTALGTAVVASGLGNWIVNSVLASAVGLGSTLITGIVAMLVNLIHLILPVAPAIVSMTVAPLTDLAMLANIHPAVLTFTIAALAGGCFLLPIDAVPIITYTKKYYSVWDMFKSGFIVSIILVILVALWVPFISKFLF